MRERFIRTGLRRHSVKDSEKFRQYARDCIRLAEKMDAKDRQTLLQIAEAWQMRAREVEKRESPGK